MQTESRRLTVFLASITALTSLSIDMSLPGIPALEHELHRTAGNGSLTLSLFLAGYAITPLVGGPLADRFGRRPILLISLLLFAISALACSFASNFSALLIFRLIQGCASGAATTLPLAIVRDLLTGSAARKRMSEVTTINSVMPLIAPIVGTWVMVRGSWRLIFGIQAVFAFVIVIVLLFDFTESSSPEQRQCLHPVDVIQNYRRLLSNPTFMGYSIMYALTFACMFSFISTSPLILMQRMHVQRSDYTLLFALIGTGTILGSFFSAFLHGRKTSVHRIMTTGLTLMTVAAFAAYALQLAHIRRPSSILPFVFLIFLGFGLTGPTATMEALEPVPQLAGSASGVLRSILMVFGSGASAFLAGYCGRHFQRAEIATTLTMSVTALCAFLIYLLQLRGITGIIRNRRIMWFNKTAGIS